MYKRIDRDPLTLKVWTDGYDTNPVSTATHIVIQNNQPGDSEVERETDYFLLDNDSNVAYLYGKSMTVKHDDHHHFHYDILTEHFDELDTGMPVKEGDVKEYVLGILTAKDYTVQFADPDDLGELGFTTSVPRTTDDFNQHVLDGYGFHSHTGVPVLTFLVDETAPPPVQWMAPLSHLMNYNWNQPETDTRTLRLGVLNLNNEIVGGWSGDAGYELVKALTNHEKYEIAIKKVSPNELPEQDKSGAFEPSVLGEIEYGIAETGYQQVEDSTYTDYRNEDGVTTREMWDNTHGTP